MSEDKLVVDPDYLEKLADAQDDAKKALESASGAPGDVGYQVWITHGVICGGGAVAITKAVKVRTTAVDNTKNVSLHLAENLRTAEFAYLATDREAGENLAKQVVSD